MKLIRHRTTDSNRTPRRRGAEVLELALILPMLVFLTFGTVEFGYFFFITHNLTGAAREGVRQGIPFGATQANAVAKARAYLTQAGLDPAKFDISITPNVESASPGTDITCYIHSTWANCGFKFKFISGSKVVFGKAVMRKEG